MSLPVLPWCGPSGSAVSVDHFAILDTNGMWIYSLSVIGGDGHQVTGWWGGGGVLQGYLEANCGTLH